MTRYQSGLLLVICLVGTNAPITHAETPSGRTALFVTAEDFDHWTGRKDLWKVEGDQIVGRTTAEAPIQANTFLIYQADPSAMADFELTLDFKIESGNSGVQYRSKVLDRQEFVVGGYQADIDFENRYAGILYEERGRGILVQRGTSVTRVSQDEQTVKRFAGDEETSRTIHPGQWNSMRVLARGNQLQQFINGVMTAELIDNETDAAARSGVIALQLHRGPPMTVRFKNIVLEPIRR